MPTTCASRPPQGFNSGDQFFAYLKDTFDVLYAEGETAPKMMSVGLHCRLVGRPGRAAALARFLDYVAGTSGSGWRGGSTSPGTGSGTTAPPGSRRAACARAIFVELFGDVFEHSPWLAESAQLPGSTGRSDTAEGLHAALVAGAARRAPAREGWRSSAPIPISPGASPLTEMTRGIRRSSKPRPASTASPTGSATASWR